MDFFKRMSAFDNIKYYDEPHCYFIDGQQVISVTTLLGVFKEKFDEPKWLEIKAGERLTEDFFLPGEDTATALDRAKKIVKGEWDYKRAHGQYEGTLFHSYMENMLANKIKPDDMTGKDGIVTYENVGSTMPKLKHLGRKFYKKYVESGWLLPVKSEMVVGSISFRLAGQIDQLFYDTRTNKLVLYDWKTNTDFKRNNRFSKLKYCLDHLDECELNIYSLQLHTYKFLFEEGTGIRLGDAPQIVWINENNSEPEVINCVDMTDEVQSMLEFKNKNPELFPFRRWEIPQEPVFESDVKSMDDLLNFDF